MPRWVRSGVFAAIALAALFATPSTASAQVRVGIFVGAPVVPAPVVVAPRYIGPYPPYYYGPYPYAYPSPYYYPYAYPYFGAYYGFGYSPYRYGVPRGRAIYRGRFRGRRY